MSNGLLALFAFTPILLAAIMLIGLRWPASRAMPLVFLFTAAIGLFVWDMSVNRIIASTLQGLVITLGLLWIIFGAILLLNTLKHSGGITAEFGFDLSARRNRSADVRRNWRNAEPKGHHLLRRRHRRDPGCLHPVPIGVRRHRGLRQFHERMGRRPGPAHGNGLNEIANQCGATNTGNPSQ